MKSSSQVWTAAVGPSSGANQVPPTSLTEDELERQYLAHKAQFEEWIEKNRHLRDPETYNRYVNQFKEWEAQVEVNRQAIRERNQRKVDHNGDQKTQPETTSKRRHHPAASEASSPPLSTATGKKKKKKKGAKETSALGNEGENPMMAMMKMMATVAASGASSSVPAPAPTPQPLPMPIDPMSMMMGMTMMMPLLMNSAPAPPAMPAAESEPPPVHNRATTFSALPDVSQRPPGFPPANEFPSQWRKQADRDRAFRSDRSYRQTNSPRDGQHLERDQKPMNLDRGGDEDCGDYWYRRPLSNHQQALPPATVDPWFPSHRHFQLSSFPRGPSAPGPTPLWPPQSAQPMRISLDRDSYRTYESPHYVNRSNFGPRTAAPASAAAIAPGLATETKRQERTKDSNTRAHVTKSATANGRRLSSISSSSGSSISSSSGSSISSSSESSSGSLSDSNSTDNSDGASSNSGNPNEAYFQEPRSHAVSDPSQCVPSSECQSTVPSAPSSSPLVFSLPQNQANATITSKSFLPLQPSVATLAKNPSVTLPSIGKSVEQLPQLPPKLLPSPLPSAPEAVEKKPDAAVGNSKDSDTIPGHNKQQKPANSSLLDSVPVKLGAGDNVSDDSLSPTATSNPSAATAISCESKSKDPAGTGAECLTQEANVKSDSSKSSTSGIGQLQNASQWRLIGMKSGTPGSMVNKHAALGTFEQFKRQAKEKEKQRLQLKKQEEEKRRQREYEERQRQERLAEQEREKVKAAVLEQAQLKLEQQRASNANRQAPANTNSQPPAPFDGLSTPKSSSSQVAPAPPQHAAARQREIDRLREQERRRRQAIENRIDLTEQLDLMASFEQTF